MRFLLDESADYPLAQFLRDRGHDVTAIAHDYPHALSDRAVLEIAVSEQRVLITNDKDFGELLVRHRLPHNGVVVLRLEDEALAAKAGWLEYVLNHYADRLADLVVVTERGVRVRHLKLAR